MNVNRQLGIRWQCLKGYMGSFSWKFLGSVFLGTTLIVVLGGLVIASDVFCCWEQYGSIVAAIASLLNAVLLFITLNHQDRAFKQERFETTFFNLLEQRRKIVDNFRLLYWRWDYVEHKPLIVNSEGMNCFTVAYGEVNFIKRNLFVSKYFGTLDWDEDKVQTSVEFALQKIHDEWNDDINAIRKMDEDFYCSLINRTYHIDYDLYKDVIKNKGNEDNELQIAFSLFVKVYTMFLEHYFRHLKQILAFVDKNDSDKNISNPQYYIDFLLSQMSREEMWIIFYYALTNDCYRKQLECFNIMTYIKGLSKF